MHGFERFVILAVLVANGCSSNGAVATPSPLSLPKVVAAPTNGHVTVVAVADKPVGNVVPVYISVANGSDDPLLESPAEIFAQGEDGNRVPVVPLTEAVAQAGGAAGLVSSLGTAAAYGLPAAAVGGVSGAAVAGLGGLSGTSALSGSLIGSAAGLITGGAEGIWTAHQAAEQRAEEQIANLSLRPTTIPPNGTASGYVFYPADQYQKLLAVMGDSESHSSVTATTKINE
jgi:hypothetical protein